MEVKVNNKVYEIKYRWEDYQRVLYQIEDSSGVRHELWIVKSTQTWFTRKMSKMGRLIGKESCPESVEFLEDSPGAHPDCLVEVDKSKLMEYNKVDDAWTTAGGVPFLASESKSSILHMIKKYTPLRGYKQLLKIDGVYFYGNPGDSEKLKQALIEKEILVPKEG